jgi:hypothetical protein
MMLDFAEQTGSGIVIMVWSFLTIRFSKTYTNSANDTTGALFHIYVPGTWYQLPGTWYEVLPYGTVPGTLVVPGTRYQVPCTEFGNQMHYGTGTR